MSVFDRVVDVSSLKLFDVHTSKSTRKSRKPKTITTVPPSSTECVELQNTKGTRVLPPMVDVSLASTPIRSLLSSLSGSSYVVIFVFWVLGTEQS